MKKNLLEISFYTCVPKFTIRYSFSDMEWSENFFCAFGPFFVVYPHP